MELGLSSDFARTGKVRWRSFGQDRHDDVPQGLQDRAWILFIHVGNWANNV